MFKRVLFAALVVLATSWNAYASENGSADEAKAMVEKAVTLIQSTGTTKAYQAFNDPAGGFVDRDLYVFVINAQGVVVAHGVNKALIGKSLYDARDTDGKVFIQEMLRVANDAGSGWVEYRWPNPSTKKVEAKASYIKAVGDKTFVGVGIYKK